MTSEGMMMEEEVGGLRSNQDHGFRSPLSTFFYLDLRNLIDLVLMEESGLIHYRMMDLVASWY